MTKRCFLLAAFLILSSLHMVSSAAVKIGVVDLQMIFGESKLRTQLLNELKAEKDRMDKNLQDLDNTLKTLQSDMMSVNPTSKKYKDTQMKLIEIETRLKIMSRQYEHQLELRRLEMKSRILKAIFTEIEGYAKENGYDFVFNKFTPAKSPELEPVFTMVYNKPEYDISAHILKRLNAPK